MSHALIQSLKRKPDPRSLLVRWLQATPNMNYGGIGILSFLVGIAAAGVLGLTQWNGLATRLILAFLVLLASASYCAVIEAAKGIQRESDSYQQLADMMDHLATGKRSQNLRAWGFVPLHWSQFLNVLVLSGIALISWTGASGETPFSIPCATGIALISSGIVWPPISFVYDRIVRAMM